MKKITIVVAVIAIIAVGIWIFTKGPSGQQVSKLDTIDTIKDFYDQWLIAAKEPATADPDHMTLAKSEILSKTLREQLVGALKSLATPDPVLCQKVVPENITVRKVYENADKAQVLVMSRDMKVTEQAVVTLNKLNEGWYIDDIECSLGEFAPEREFSFEREGFLLKGSIPPPYDSKNWHLVFEENGEAGHAAPLFFNSESQCTGLDGSKSVCKPDQFTEAIKVSVHGQMSERGVSVKRLEFVK